MAQWIGMLVVVTVALVTGVMLVVGASEVRYRMRRRRIRNAVRASWLNIKGDER